MASRLGNMTWREALVRLEAQRAYQRQAELARLLGGAGERPLVLYGQGRETAITPGQVRSGDAGIAEALVGKGVNTEQTPPTLCGRIDRHNAQAAARVRGLLAVWAAVAIVLGLAVLGWILA